MFGVLCPLRSPIPFRGNPAGHVPYARGSDGSPERTPLCLRLTHDNVTVACMCVNNRIKGERAHPQVENSLVTMAGRSTRAADACKTPWMWHEKLKVWAAVRGGWMYECGESCDQKHEPNVVVSDVYRRRSSRLTGVQDWQNLFLFSLWATWDPTLTSKLKKTNQLFPIGKILLSICRLWIYCKSWTLDWQKGSYTGIFCVLFQWPCEVLQPKS